MRKTRGLIAAFALTLAAGITSTGAADAAPHGSGGAGGRLLYIDLTGSTNGVGALKSSTPSGQGVQDFGRQLPWYSSPSYSPDGTRIAFVGGDIGFSVMVMNADGTGDQWLIDGPSVPSYPRWAPDGQSVAYQFDGIGRIGLDGSRSTLSPSEDNDLAASWSPSGTRLATASPRDIETPWPDDSTGKIRIRSGDGQVVRRTIPLPGAVRVAWSPDGRQIAAEARGDLYLINPNTGSVRQVTATPDVQESDPTWSPDGTKLAYAVEPGSSSDTGPTAASKIWTMDRGGRHQHSTGINGVPTSWKAAD
ncbi:PD40 domain-containing protein [Luteipulveratus mongoliensis]|uniref:Lipoprotein LpqB beta-propeller domain-containing protein n=1 Tax=Luteipulveratus mongoliensis TaxID=571913 RepID=A0A0K1JDJ7_9MICO|nr:PD40 domain-containing protein [Luteipulveratus mongoliensis]AKU14771.1 hypothetical protein VV02_00905 [Luteipulveratus mongoliensis]